MLIFNSFFEYGFVGCRRRQQLHEESRVRPTVRRKLPLAVMDEVESFKEKQLGHLVKGNGPQTSADMSTNPYFAAINNYWEYLVRKSSHLPTIEFMMTDQMKTFLKKT